MHNTNILPPKAPLIGLVVASLTLAVLLCLNQGPARHLTPQPARPPTTSTAGHSPPTSRRTFDYRPVTYRQISRTRWRSDTDASPASPAGTDQFEWPLAPPHQVLRPFQPPTTPWGPGHRGVDLGGHPGESVVAAGSGLVLYAGPLADRSLVSIEHQGGLRTTYEPVHPTVRVGQYVQRGQVIGVLMAGHPGCPARAPGVCLHWGAHRDGVYLDPLRLVESGHVRLLPWPPGVP